MAIGGYRHAADLPQVIPVFPLDGVLLLPHGMLPLNIFEPRYLNMIDDAMAGDRMIGMIQTQAGMGDDHARPPLAQIGCAGRITSYAETPDGRYLITLTGVCRFRAGPELPVQTPYRQIRAAFAPFEQDLGEGEPEAPGVDRPALLDALKCYLEHRGLDVDWKMAGEAPLEALVNSLSMALPFDQAEKQALLEAETLQARLQALTALLRIGAADDEDSPHQVQ
ncbi:MAG TPA: LON peptidase substrate-binding domain-containing protein [Caulobacteraceae bacterium]|jgi:Lon protease-like protein|nr:LON peptidase substrate-binding domain-containing protein [Caulobacteraceae bacterium]